jgi:hypothetical protein
MTFPFAINDTFEADRRDVPQEIDLGKLKRDR